MAQTFNGKPGDLIEISHGLYNQWAVYIGENEVIHFTTDDTGGQSSGLSASLRSTTGKVKREKFTDVVGNHRYQVNNLLDNRRQARDPSFIVKEACAMVDTKPQYNVDTYNSKHFATEMRYGKFKGKPGDLIEINRGAYKHWAVYIGENKVVHLVRDGGRLLSAKAEVKHEELTDVPAIHHLQVNNLLDEEYKARDPSVIVKEACEMVGRELSYGVVKYNSKHFATEMRYGVAESRQFNGNKGDLIEICRGHYHHWAVYVGENEVVHLVNECVQSSGWFTRPSSSSSSSGSPGQVKLQKFTDVVRNHGYQVNNLLDKKYKALDPSDIEKAALAKVGPKQYNLATYNCEHFATEMRYGKPESRQVIKAAVITVSGVTVGAGALVAGAPVVAVVAAGTAVAAGAVAFCKAPCSRGRSSR